MPFYFFLFHQCENVFMPKFPSLTLWLVSISRVNGSLSDKNTFGNVSYFIQVSHAYYSRYFESQPKHEIAHFCVI